MASAILVGVSFLLFFVVVGFTWLLGNYIISQLVASLPVPESGPWRDIYDQNVENIETIILFLPGVLFLFAAIKMLVNATSRGAD